MQSARMTNNRLRAMQSTIDCSTGSGSNSRTPADPQDVLHPSSRLLAPEIKEQEVKDVSRWVRRVQTHTRLMALTPA